MVVGAMLLSGSSAGLGIPKSPSFHSGLELAAAAKDFNFHSSSAAIAASSSSTSATSGLCITDNMPSTSQDQMGTNKVKYRRISVLFEKIDNRVFKITENEILFLFLPLDTLPI